MPRYIESRSESGFKTAYERALSKWLIGRRFRYATYLWIITGVHIGSSEEDSYVEIKDVDGNQHEKMSFWSVKRNLFGTRSEKDVVASRGWAKA